MIVVASKEGQFANRIIHFANIYAFCKTNNIKLVHPYFNAYSNYFKNLKPEKKLIIIGKSRFAKKLINTSLKFFRILYRKKIYNLGIIESIVYTNTQQNASVYNLNNPAFIKKAKSKIVLLYGWLFRDFENVTLQRDNILRLFSFPLKITQQAEEAYNKLIRKDIVSIGVHIRRGDYKEFENGRWYYTDQVYAGMMKQIAQQLQSASVSYKFIICSNDKVNLSLFEELPVCYEQRHFLVDFLLLSQCNFITGPPSTFSALASFWGKTPLLHLADRDSAAWLSDFKVLDTL